ncbi:MAG: hypothetical protein IJX24_06930 [Oscillospiraceae bacterium]|nr:hypothetical protein [Oscillospiraceae bacterium]
MTTEGLRFIADCLLDAGINYSFREWSGSPVYPYFVGEYTESTPLYENGEAESVFILTGTTDDSWISLELVKEKLRSLFPDTGKTHIFDSKNAIAVMYSDSFCIPTGTGKFKRIQINFNVKEWKGD